MTDRMPAHSDGMAGRFRRARDKLLNDPAIHPINRNLFRQFFDHEEYKLKRINGLQRLDVPTYRTLYVYIIRFCNVNRWFGNRPLTEITREDIQRVYDGLEDGTIVNASGLPYQSRTDYYNKVFKSKLFQLSGKQELARQVIEFCKPNNKEVRFIREQGFRQLMATVRQPLHQLLFWLVWDYGENINAQIQLRKTDFHRQTNADTGEPEYRVNFRPAILKRSRRARSELTNYPETVALLDRILPTIDDDQPIFPFGYANARKIMKRAVAASGVTCEPKGDSVTWKDLRSGMACDLLAKGWSRDEVNARLGHKPSSQEIDAYINFLALDRRRPKHKVHEFQTGRLRSELDAARQREQLLARRSQELARQLDEQRDQMRRQMEAMKQVMIEELKAEIHAATLSQPRKVAG